MLYSDLLTTPINGNIESCCVKFVQCEAMDPIILHHSNLTTLLPDDDIDYRKAFSIVVVQTKFMPTHLKSKCCNFCKNSDISSNTYDFSYISVDDNFGARYFTLLLERKKDGVVGLCSFHVSSTHIFVQLIIISSAFRKLNLATCLLSIAEDFGRLFNNNRVPIVIMNTLTFNEDFKEFRNHRYLIKPQKLHNVMNNNRKQKPLIDIIKNEQELFLVHVKENANHTHLSYYICIVPIFAMCRQDVYRNYLSPQNLEDVITMSYDIIFCNIPPTQQKIDSNVISDLRKLYGNTFNNNWTHSYVTRQLDSHVSISTNDDTTTTLDIHRHVLQSFVSLSPDSCTKVNPILLGDYTNIGESLNNVFFYLSFIFHEDAKYYFSYRLFYSLYWNILSQIVSNVNYPHQVLTSMNNIPSYKNYSIELYRRYMDFTISLRDNNRSLNISYDVDYDYQTQVYRKCSLLFLNEAFPGSIYDMGLIFSFHNYDLLLLKTVLSSNLNQQSIKPNNNKYENWTLHHNYINFPLATNNHLYEKRILLAYGVSILKKNKDLYLMDLKSNDQMSKEVIQHNIRSNTIIHHHTQKILNIKNESCLLTETVFDPNTYNISTRREWCLSPHLFISTDHVVSPNLKFNIYSNATEYVDYIMSLVSEDFMLNVTDAIQNTTSQWSFLKYSRFLKLQQRTHLIDEICFNISDTSLSELIKAPSFVNSVSMIDIVCPKNKTKQFFSRDKYFFFASIKGCYKDFEIQRMGSSVWHHAMIGRLIICIIQPTHTNLHAYKNWRQDENRHKIFFPVLVTDKNTIVFAVLEQKQTISIPSGHMYAILTEQDTVGVRGNFHHLFSLQMQLDAHEIDVNENIKNSFDSDCFVQLNIYAVEYFFSEMKKMNIFVIEKVTFHRLIKKCLEWIKSEKEHKLLYECISYICQRNTVISIIEYFELVLSWMPNIIHCPGFIQCIDYVSISPFAALVTIYKTIFDTTPLPFEISPSLIKSHIFTVQELSSLSYYTSIFICPITGEIFKSTPIAWNLDLYPKQLNINNSTKYVFVQGLKEMMINQKKVEFDHANEYFFFISSKQAVECACAFAFDCLNQRLYKKFFLNNYQCSIIHKRAMFTVCETHDERNGLYLTPENDKYFRLTKKSNMLPIGRRAPRARVNNARVIHNTVDKMKAVYKRILKIEIEDSELRNAIHAHRTIFCSNNNTDNTSLIASCTSYPIAICNETNICKIVDINLLATLILNENESTCLMIQSNEKLQAKETVDELRKSVDELRNNKISDDFIFIYPFKCSQIELSIKHLNKIQFQNVDVLLCNSIACQTSWHDNTTKISISQDVLKQLSLMIDSDIITKRLIDFWMIWIRRHYMQQNCPIYCCHTSMYASLADREYNCVVYRDEDYDYDLFDKEEDNNDSSDESNNNSFESDNEKFDSNRKEDNNRAQIIDIRSDNSDDEYNNDKKITNDNNRLINTKSTGDISNNNTIVIFDISSLFNYRIIFIPIDITKNNCNHWILVIIINITSIMENHVSSEIDKFQMYIIDSLYDNQNYSHVKQHQEIGKKILSALRHAWYKQNHIDPPKIDIHPHNMLPISYIGPQQDKCQSDSALFVCSFALHIIQYDLTFMVNVGKTAPFNSKIIINLLINVDQKYVFDFRRQFYEFITTLYKMQQQCESITKSATSPENSLLLLTKNNKANAHSECHKFEENILPENTIYKLSDVSETSRKRKSELSFIDQCNKYHRIKQYSHDFCSRTIRDMFMNIPNVIRVCRQSIQNHHLLNRIASNEKNQFAINAIAIICLQYEKELTDLYNLSNLLNYEVDDNNNIVDFLKQHVIKCMLLMDGLRDLPFTYPICSVVSIRKYDNELYGMLLCQSYIFLDEYNIFIEKTCDKEYIKTHFPKIIDDITFDANIDQLQCDNTKGWFVIPSNNDSTLEMPIFTSRETAISSYKNLKIAPIILSSINNINQLEINKIAFVRITVIIKSMITDYNVYLEQHQFTSNTVQNLPEIYFDWHILSNENINDSVVHYSPISEFCLSEIVGSGLITNWKMQSLVYFQECSKNDNSSSSGNKDESDFDYSFCQFNRGKLFLPNHFYFSLCHLNYYAIKELFSYHFYFYGQKQNQFFGLINTGGKSKVKKVIDLTWLKSNHGEPFCEMLRHRSTCVKSKTIANKWKNDIVILQKQLYPLHNPPLQYIKSNMKSCPFTAAASVFHYFHEYDLAKRMIKKRDDYETHEKYHSSHDIATILIDKNNYIKDCNQRTYTNEKEKKEALKEAKYYNKHHYSVFITELIREQNDYKAVRLTKSFDLIGQMQYMKKNEFAIVQLRDTNNCVCITKDYIFESNCSNAITLSNNTLNAIVRTIYSGISHGLYIHRNGSCPNLKKFSEQGMSLLHFVLIRIILLKIP